MSAQVPQMICADSRLQGAVAVVQLPNNQWGIAAQRTRKIVIAWQGPYVGFSDSGDLGSEPGCIMLFNGFLWTICADGSLRALKATCPPLQIASTAIFAAVSIWITSSGSVIIAPYRQGGICSLSNVGTLLSKYENVLTDVAFAIAYSGYVLCFDSNGNGAILQVNGTTGIFTWIGPFVAKDCDGPLTGFILGSTLYLAVMARAAVVTFDLTTPTAPVQTARVTYDAPPNILNQPPRLHSVLNDAVRTPLTNVPQDAVGLATWWSAVSGFTDGTHALIAFGLAGRLAFTSSQSPPLPFQVRVATEDGNLLQQEALTGSHFLYEGRPV